MVYYFSVDIGQGTAHAGTGCAGVTAAAERSGDVGYVDLRWASCATQRAGRIRSRDVGIARGARIRAG